MKLSDNGLEFIKTREGIVFSDSDATKIVMYNDSAGHATIGYGHLVHRGKIDGSEKQEFRDGISQVRADELLRIDVERFEKLVNTQVNVDLSQSQFDALVSFAFNIPKGMDPSQSTLLRNLNDGDYAGVPTQLNRWCKETIYEESVDDEGRVTSVKKLVINDGLLRRRNLEGNLFAEGVY